VASLTTERSESDVEKSTAANPPAASTSKADIRTDEDDVGWGVSAAGQSHAGCMRGILCGSDPFERTAEGTQIDTVQLIQQIAADAVVVEGSSPLESGQPSVGQDRVVRTRISGAPLPVTEAVRDAYRQVAQGLVGNARRHRPSRIRPTFAASANPFRP
jgi:hypothetical protein